MDARGHSFTGVNISGSSRAHLGDSYLVFNQTISSGSNVQGISPGDISVQAAITGLLTVAAETAETLKSVLKRRSYADTFPHTMLTEVDSFSSTLDALSGIVNDTNSRKARLSLISAEDVFVPLTEAIHIFDQLEQVLKQIESFEWYLADYQANKLVVRLQDCNSALFLQLSILQSHSNPEARQAQKTLEETIQEILSSQTVLKLKFEALEARLSQRSLYAVPDGASTHPGAPLNDIHPWEAAMPNTDDFGRLESTQGPLRDFEESLLSSWVYRRGQNREEDMSFDTLTYRTGAGSILSQITLADISIISVVALPLCISELNNGAHYTTDSGVGLYAHEAGQGGTSLKSMHLEHPQNPTSLDYTSAAPPRHSPGPWSFDEIRSGTKLLLFPLGPFVDPIGIYRSVTQTLAVHLHLKADVGAVSAFCVHSHAMSLIESRTHEQRAIAGSRDYCQSTAIRRKSSLPVVRHKPVNRVTYVVAHYLQRRLRRKTYTMTEALYEGIKNTLDSMDSKCMMCFLETGAKLNRPGLCSSVSCMDNYLRLGVELRMEDARNDYEAVDLLITAVYAVAMRAEEYLVNLLPLLPGALCNALFLCALGENLPDISQLACGRNASEFLSDEDIYGLAWACIGYRGFLVSAPDSYRIPNLPGIHQFLLADAAPELEARFAKYDHFSVRHAVFHGTSMERLYAILSKGLKLPINMPFPHHSSSSGPGIGVCKEPAFALDYARTPAPSDLLPGSRAKFMRARVLLGCELVHDAGGQEYGHRGLPLVLQPDRIMVRYVFIVPQGVKVPNAQEIAPAMLSNFHTLRQSRLG